MITDEKKTSISITLLFIISILFLLNVVYSRRVISSCVEECNSIQSDLAISELNTQQLLIELLKKSEIFAENFEISVDNDMGFIVMVVNDLSCSSCVQKIFSFADKYKIDNNRRIVLFTSEDTYHRYKPYDRLENVDVIKSMCVTDYLGNWGFLKSLVVRCNNKLLPEQVLLSDDTDIIDDFLKQ